jgi:hypothetical protein
MGLIIIFAVPSAGKNLLKKQKDGVPPNELMERPLKNGKDLK